MANSNCIKCGNSSFELVERDRIKGSRFKYNFIQCTSCGGVVGVVEYFNLGARLERIMARLGIGDS